MESGVEDRSRLRHHVRAAREWLGRAEDSLDRAEDVRGDLNLMLARAELARAQETERPRPSVLWMRRIAPLCTAALLAGGILWTWDFAAPPAPPPVEKRTEEAAAEAGTLQRIGESPPLPAIPQPDSVRRKRRRRKRFSQSRNTGRSRRKRQFLRRSRRPRRSLRERGFPRRTCSG